MRSAAARRGEVNDRQHPELVVDHCHKSKQIRGLVCHRCNVGLGYFRDDPELLRAAAAYLEAQSKE